MIDFIDSDAEQDILPASRIINPEKVDIRHASVTAGPLTETLYEQVGRYFKS